MTATRPIAMASGIVPGLSPQATIKAAAAGGFDAVGLWVVPTEWSKGTSADVRGQLAGSGLSTIDVEVIWIKPGPLDPDHLRILDIGLEVNAANALVVSSDPDLGATAEKFAALCRHVEGTKLRVALEFGLFTDVKTIGMATAILRSVDHPAAALLVDSLHLNRSGGSPDDVQALPPSWFSYAQICDAPALAPAPDDASAILEEAVYGRLQTGDGALPLPALLNALPDDLPLSVELRSRALYERYPNVEDRARVTARITRDYLATLPARR